jgi:imidazolonepropionase-like amidohydrolase
MIAEGVTTHRGEVGLRPRHRDRAEDAARRKAHRAAAAACRSAPPSSAPMRCRRNTRPPRRLHRRGRAARAACRPCRGLVDAVDGFCEGIAFSPAQIARVFAERARSWPAGEAACRAALQPGGAKLAARMARCRPTISNISTRRRRAMAAAGTVAVILPGAFYTCAKRKLPPIAAAAPPRRADGGGDRLQPRLLALTSLPLAMNMACTLFRMTPEEALLGHGACRPRAWPDRPRPHRAGPARRPCDLGRRPPGRTGLPHRRHAPACPHLRRPP